MTVLAGKRWNFCQSTTHSLRMRCIAALVLLVLLASLSGVQGMVNEGVCKLSQGTDTTIVVMRSFPIYVLFVV